MKKILTTLLVALVAALALVFGSTPAYAAGSNDPTPYTVTLEGIQLSDNVTFQDGGHINVTSNGVTYNVHFEAKCINRTDAECAGDRHKWAQFIGKSFIGWDSIGIDMKHPYCISWVQLSQYNEHFGEGGQSPVGTAPGCGGNTPPDTIVNGDWKYTVTCQSQVGDVVDATRTVTTTRYWWYKGELKSETTTKNENGKYTIQLKDTLALDCRTDIVPPAIVLTPAVDVCTDDGYRNYTNATVTLPQSDKGQWNVNPGKQTLEAGTTTTYVFTFDASKYKVSTAPSGEGWTATLDGNKISYQIQIPARAAEDCELAESGGSIAWGAGVIGLAALAVGAGLLIRKRREA